jgi:hypothetical protein
MIIAKDWYWFVGGSTTQVYSSARNIYVDPASDANFQTWKGIYGPNPAIADNEADIWNHVQYVLPLWLWNGTTMSQPGAGLYTKDQLGNYNANARLDKVNGGMTAAGIPIKTDDRSRQFVAAGRQMAEADSSFTTQWYGSDGNFYPVDAPTMISMSTALGNHTNSCYDVFKTTTDGINNNTITTLAQIDNAYSSLFTTAAFNQ